MKRPRLAVLGALAVGLIAYLYWPASPVEAPAPSAGDCVIVELWSNGFHTDMVAPADMFDSDHPLRLMWPHAGSFMIGWGDEAFYRSDGTDVWAGLDALVPPSPSTMHVVASEGDVGDYFIPKIEADVAVSRAGAARLAEFIAAELEVDAQGLPVLIAPGKLEGRSVFLRGRTGFHAFNVCNHWMARAMRTAGLDINVRTAWLADPMVEAAQRRGGACPT